MWLNFFFAYALIILVLFVPGFLFFRGLGLTKISSLIFAPVFSIASLCLLGIAFSKIGLTCSTFSIGVPLLLAPAALFFFRRQHKNTDKEGKTDWGIAALYIFMGIAVGAYVYLLPLDGPESIVQTYDNVFHYNITESFIESGIWSVLGVGYYLADPAIDPFPGVGFYPAGWHMLAAFASSALQTSAPLAANAANFAFCSIVFPVSLFSLLRALFPEKPGLVAVGAIVCCIQTAFPWSLYDVWPLFPNGASFCTCMLVGSLFISAIENAKSRNLFATYAAGFILGLMSLAFLQPNAVFVLMAFLMPYLLWKIALYETEEKKREWRKTALVCIAFLVLFAILLLILFNLPFLQGTLTYYWPPLYEPSGCIKSIASWSLATNDPQPQIALLLLCGIAFLLLNTKRSSWLVVSLLSSVFIFFVVAGTPETPLKHFIGGYWYSDPYRIAAFCGLFSIPVASAGLYAIASLLERLLKQKAITPAYAYAGCTAALVFVTFIPTLPTSHAFESVRACAYGQNSAVWNFLDNDEISFIGEVQEVVPNDTPIINQPFDGSMYAFGKTGIDLYYRVNTNYGIVDGETEESRLIRKKLKDIDSDEQVRRAVRQANASYVLLLKPDFKDIGMYYPNYNPEAWEGIDGINDQTPGFTVVLERDSMKLYRIDD